MNGFNFKLTITFVVVFIFFSHNNYAQRVKWSDLSYTNGATFYDYKESFEKQEKKWKRADKRAKRKGLEVKEHGGEEVYKRWESYMSPRVYPSGNLALPSNTYQNYIAWQKEQQNAKIGAMVQASNWSELGPIGSPSGPQPYSRTGAGRINFLRFDPNNSDIMYVGAPDGGLWKSTDAGNSWATNTDFLSIIGCSDLAIDPTNTQIMYLATGDLEGDRMSAGILKSTDGGATWNTTILNWAPDDFLKASKLLMNPTNPLNMILATNNGIYRTTDGWVTRTKGVFPAGSPSLKDMEFKPGDPNTIYASGKEIYKSIDNGANWVEVSSGIPAGIERIALGVSANNSSYVYALIADDTDRKFLGLYRSVDSGTTFTERSTSPNILGYEADGSDTEGQGNYDLAITVSPTDVNLITIGGINHWQSIDGGRNWVNLSVWDSGEVHADIHEISYLPGSSTTMFSCNDGGIFKSTDNGNNFVDISHNLAISQVVGIGLSTNVESKILSGEQDNGTNLKTGPNWGNIRGGDGGDCFFDYTNNNTIYIQYVEGAFSRSDDGGATNEPITSGLPAGFDFYSPWIIDPVNPNKLYVGGIPELYVSSNKGNSWTELGTPSGTGTIKSIAVAPSNTSIIYVVKEDAVSKSINGGVSFFNITGTLPVVDAALAGVTVSNLDPLKVWVIFSGYSTDSKVFKSVDGGNTWTNISAGLPNLPINTIVYTNETAPVPPKNSKAHSNASITDAIYIGADIGVFYMDNSTAWTPYNTNLPNVAVRDLEIYYPTNKLRAGTYGRGVWESPLFTNAPLPVTFINFNVETINENNVLNWAVSMESYIQNYEIQRSDNGSNFKTIATVVAKNTNDETAYNYTDNNPIYGANYYRILANDLDNKKTYTKIVYSFTHKTEYQIYPNPASEMLQIEAEHANFSVQLIDEAGKVVYKNTNSANKMQIDISKIAPGNFFLEILKPDGTKLIKKIKINR